MPEDPLLIFDGRCGFCKIWIEYWKVITRGRLAYAPSQEVGDNYPQIPKEEFGKSVQLVMPSGEVVQGARAVFTTLTYAPGMAWLLWAYEHVPGFAPLTEAAYRWIAAHRNVAYQLTRFTFGLRIRPLETAKVEWLFLRALAAIYFAAFASLAVQITGLIGERGILPASRYLAAVSKIAGAYWEAPTIFWIAHGDGVLKAACWAGAAIALVLVFGIAGWLPGARCAGLFVRPLSFVLHRGSGFLCPSNGTRCCSKPGFSRSSWAIPRSWSCYSAGCLFRVMFLSGVVKLTSHDPTWRDRTAVAFHYLTQPLPTPIAWYMYQLPLWFQHVSTSTILFIELVIPFLFFAPRRWRFWGAGFALFLQVMIFLTGNYTFFNLLTMALCLFLFDDHAFEKLCLRARNIRTSRLVAIAAAVVLLALSASELQEMFFASCTRAAERSCTRRCPLPDREYLRGVRFDDHQPAGDSSTGVERRSHVARL